MSRAPERRVPTLPTPKGVARRITPKPYPLPVRPVGWLPPGTPIPGTRAVVGPDGITGVWPLVATP